MKSKLDIQSIGEYWRISGVKYRRGIYTIDLAKQLLPPKTIDEHAEHRNQAMEKDEFYVEDMPIYHSLFTVLFNLKSNPEAEKARAFIQKNMRERELTTLTRIPYTPTGKDKIIHNYGTNDQYEIQESIVGEDGYIKSKDSKALTALLGTGDIAQINSVYNWINKTDAYICRLSSKPEQVVERVTRFEAGSDWVYFDCYGNPQNSNSGLGVRRAKILEPDIEAHLSEIAIKEGIKNPEELKKAIKFYKSAKNLFTS